MHSKTVLAKTASGNEELSSRKLRLSPQTRTVLIAIDGRRDVGELEQMFSAYGEKNRQILNELVQLGLVADVAASTATAAANATAAAAPQPVDQDLDLMGVRKLINDQAVDAAGLRAYLFTLKLERCYTVPELRATIDGFHALLTKHKGAAYANERTEHIKRVLDRLEAQSQTADA
jgi:hypothetical protein